MARVARDPHDVLATCNVNLDVVIQEVLEV